MLKIKHTSDNKWIVYNTDNFAHHTHTPHKRIAIRLKYMAEHHIEPRTRNVKFIDSLIRIAGEGRYKRLLEAYREELANDNGTD